MVCSLMRRSVRSLGRRRPLARTLETCRLVGPKRIEGSFTGATVDLNLDLLAQLGALLVQREPWLRATLRLARGLLRPCRGGGRKCWGLLVGPGRRSCRWQRRWWG